VLRTQRMTGDAAIAVAKRASSTFFTLVGIAALAAAVATGPADAKKRKGNEKPAEAAIPDPDNGEPMTLVVSLGNQKVDIYRGTTLITSSSVSTGMRGHSTKAGVFSVLEKQRYHHSNIYSGAPMPWMQRLTWSGTALHAGVVPGYPASHGCIRLPFSFAPKLFGITTVGEHVVVSRDRPAPQLIEHANLFQPLPPPAAPVMVKQDQPPQRQSSNETEPVRTISPALPIILAKADTGSVTLDRTPAVDAETSDPADHAATEPAQSEPRDHAAGVSPAAPVGTSVGAIEDTHAHAIDPTAGSPVSAPGDHAFVVSSTSAPGDHAAAEMSSAGTNAHAVSEEDSDDSGPVAAAPVEAAAPETPAVVMAPAAPPAAAAPEVAAVTAPSIEAAPEAALMPVLATAPAPAAEPTPAAPDAIPSVVATKAGAGTKAAAILAAEPRSTAPLRILVTRRTQRDRIVGVQTLLAEMDYLMPQDFDGTLGKASVTAIKAFQKANGLPETGTFTDELVKKVYEVAGKGEPPAGHLFVRQEFGRVFDAAVSFRDPETPLGTYLFTAMKFAPGDTKTQWMAITVQGDDPTSALDRLEIPNDVRQKISERLTPGSSLIIGDIAINSASLPKGADFLVWAKDTPAKITAASIDGDIAPPRAKKKTRSVRRYNYNYGNSYSRNYQPRTYSRGYPQWPW
jgi:lipoprotein-anchoring transpeptidase ErfK/SrfK/peptidoglycan hydrolase-like protein with peptidoglycan-binding domain